MSKQTTAALGVTLCVVGVFYHEKNRRKEGGASTAAGPSRKIQAKRGHGGGGQFNRVGMRSGGARKEVRGLRNLDNTCFVNVVLQSLASIPPFVEYLKDQVESSDACILRTPTPFTSELLRIVMDLLPASPPLSVLNPKTLWGLLRDKVDHFKGSDQQDAQELLQMVMSLLSEEAGSVKNEFADTRSSDERAGLQCLAELHDESVGTQRPADSRRSNPLRGLQSSLTSCNKCTNTSHRVEPFVDLSLTLPEARDEENRTPIHLNELLKDYTETQVIEQVECDICKGKRAARRTMLVSRAPETLCLHFPRRHLSPRGFLKLRQHVKFPLHLDLAPFCTGTGHHTDVVAVGPSQTEGATRTATVPSPSLSTTPKASPSLSNPGLPSTPTTNGGKHALVGGGGSVETTKPGAISGRTVTNGSGEMVGCSTGLGVNMNGSSRGGCRGAPDERLGSTGAKYWYDLRAVIVHHGGAEGGHYTAFRNLAAPNDVTGGVMEITQNRLLRPDPWVSLSDETVKTVDVEEVQASQAYMLFYGKR